MGSFVRPEDVARLRQMGITTIISVQSDQDLDNYKISLKKLLKAYDQAEIEFLRIPIPDFDPKALATDLPQAVEKLEEVLVPRWARVYVHCTAGINRGPTIAAAYLIKTRGFSAQEAYDYVTTRRHCNPYLATLEAYEIFLRNEQAV